MKKIALLAVCLGVSVLASGQSTEELLRFNQDHLQMNFLHAIILMAWAVLNLTVGGYLTWLKRGEVEAFWHMNAAFNLVNFCIAAVMLWRTDAADPAATGLQESLHSILSTHGLMMLNIGLDIGYALTGLWIKEYGRRRINKAAMLRGFGQALILQGIFLLCLDITFTSLYYLQYSRALELVGAPRF